MHQIYELKVLTILEWREEQDSIQWILFGPKHSSRAETLVYLTEYGDDKGTYLIKKEDVSDGQ